MANTLKLEIVTPEGRTFPATGPDGKPEANDVEMVTLPGSEGEMGIYPMHVPMMTQIMSGEITVRKDGRDFYLAVGEGFVEITGDHVAVMTDMAIKAENIDEAKAEEARRRAQARLAEKLSDEDATMVHAALAHSLAQLKVKRRTHS